MLAVLVAFAPGCGNDGEAGDLEPATGGAGGSAGTGAGGAGGGAECNGAGTPAAVSASCTQVDVQAAIDSAQDGDTILVPAGTCSWKAGITTSKGVTLLGAGIGQTIIEDNVSSENEGSNSTGSIFRLKTEAGQAYRISGFEFRAGARLTKLTSGIINLSGESSAVRIDHNAFDQTRNHHVRINGWVRGVADNNRHRSSKDGGDAQVYHIWHAGWAGGTLGDSSFSEEIDWGGPNAWYIENNQIEGVGLSSSGANYFATSTDTYAGARFVFRYNTLVNAALPTHGTGDGAGRNRGLRQFEVYANSITYNPKSAHNTMHVRGGTGIYYDNVHVGATKSLTLHYYRAGGARSDGGKFGPADGLNAFDINDPGGTDGVFASGTAGPGSTENTLVVPGASFSPNQWRGYTVRVPVSSVHPQGRFNSGVITNTHDTISVKAPNFPEDNPHVFVPGEPFEIRRVLLGLDQTGAGTSDLLTDKSTTPTPINLNQKFDPVYVWGNTLNDAKPVGGSDNLFEDLHYMQEVAGYDGSSGMGVGLLSARPASPTLLRTAYFATDVGSKGTLFVWDGTAWLERWTPYTYPHPLAACP
jgi:hypothetical protein